MSLPDAARTATTSSTITVKPRRSVPPVLPANRRRRPEFALRHPFGSPITVPTSWHPVACGHARRAGNPSLRPSPGFARPVRQRASASSVAFRGKHSLGTGMLMLSRLAGPPRSTRSRAYAAPASLPPPSQGSLRPGGLREDHHEHASEHAQIVAAVEYTTGDGEKKSYWTRIGVASENGDGSLNLVFNSSRPTSRRRRSRSVRSTTGTSDGARRASPGAAGATTAARFGDQ